MSLAQRSALPVEITSVQFVWTPESGWTLGIAIAALLLSLFTIVAQALRNRTNLTCGLIMWSQEYDGGRCKLYLLCALHNRSREPICVDRFALKYGDEYLSFAVHPFLVVRGSVLVGEGLSSVNTLRKSEYSTAFPLNLAGLWGQECVLYGNFPVPAVPRRCDGARLEIRIYTTKKPVDVILQTSAAPLNKDDLF